MHSMHQVRSLSSGPLIQQQHQHSIQQQELNGVPSDQQEQLSMTVLEALEPAQASQQQQAVVHHLGPVQAAPPAIQLHQLQPSSRHLIEQQQQHELERQQQEHREDRQTNGNAIQSQTNDSNGRQCHSGGQLEGIVADGGGPIVQWLLENYEIADGESLPRSTVYNHYLAHCRSLRLSSVNAASFGKLIRSVFIGLKTRRLGTRGHSKYHYFGVRAKQHVRFDWLHEDPGSNGTESGRAACSSAAGMMRDDTNSNCGSEGGGQCGSETDSTGNCSGRLSTSMGSQTNGIHTNSSNNNNNHAPDRRSSKRPKRSQVSNGLMPENHSQNYREHGATLEDLDHQQHLHQSELHYQNDLSQEQVSNGVHYGPVHQINGHHKQEILVYGYEQQQWSNFAFSNPYDLASLRQRLNLELAATLVQDSWPEREPNQLESQLRAARTGPGGEQVVAVVANPADKNTDVQDLEQLINLIEPFEANYKNHFKIVVELLSDLNFAEVGRLWSAFWQPQTQHWTDSNSVATEQQHLSQYANGNEQLTFEQLRQLTRQPAVMDRVVQIDRKMFTAIESFLVGDMLSPMPRPLVQQLCAFSHNICHWIETALKEYDANFVARKLSSARAFEQALRRCTSINQLSVASKAVWSRRAVLAQMSADLSRLDLGDIERQVASLMSQEKFVGMDTAHRDDNLLMGNSIELAHQQQQLISSSPVTIEASDKMAQNGSQTANYVIEHNYTSQHLNHHHTSTNGNQNNSRAAIYNSSSRMQPGQLVQSFIHLLEDPLVASAWPEWCRSLVESRVSGRSLEEARNFILRWNFYISLILRELTLRSAPSLGSFQLVRLLFDEFIYYSVVSKLNHEESAQKLDQSHI